jgi:spermidine/putrescine-binding protein
MSEPISRRAFLKLSGASLAGWSLRPALATLAAPVVAATLPLPFPHRYLPNPDTLLARLTAGVDLLLVPAHVAAGLIQQSRLLRLAGPGGRAHDPEGAYTVPYRFALAALAHRVGAAPDEPWQPSVAWPSFGRLLLGAALQRRGYSPNDPHAGHVAEAARDLLQRRPALAADPLAVLLAGDAVAAFAPVPVNANGEPELAEGLAAMLPPWGGVLLEYDWVVPVNAPDPEAARALVADLSSATAPTRPDGLRFPPLMPLPKRLQAQQAGLWAELTRARR